MGEFDATSSPPAPRASSRVEAAGSPGKVKAEDLPDHFRARLDAFRRRTGRSASTGDQRPVPPAHVLASQLAAQDDLLAHNDASALLDELSQPPPQAEPIAEPAVATVAAEPVANVALIAPTAKSAVIESDSISIPIEMPTPPPAVVVVPAAQVSAPSAIEPTPSIPIDYTPSPVASKNEPTAQADESPKVPRDHALAATESDSSGSDAGSSKGTAAVSSTEQPEAIGLFDPPPSHAMDMLVGADAPLLIPLPLTSRQPASIDELPPRTEQPLSDEPVVLDPGGADIPPTPPRAVSKPVPPHLTAVFGTIFGFAAIASVLALLIQLDPNYRSFGSIATSASASAKAAPVVSAAQPEPVKTEPAAPPVWRVSQMADEDGVKIIEGKPGQKSLVDALSDDNIPKPQIFRLLKAFDDTKRFDHPRKNDSYIVAIDKPTKRIRAFEYKVSATEIYQARENEEGKLAGGKLDLHVEQHRVAKALVVKDDIKAAISDAGLDDDLISALDDAFEGRVHLSRLKKGATLRVIAQEQTVAGKFAKYIDIEAVEYLGASKDAKPLRIYHYKGKTAGHYDASGKAPYNGGPWRWPLQTPRITSKFNPQRMHPVLHTIMPHNGCDFGAATGTPIYAASAGTIATLGPSGPSGNLVTIDHGGGLVTGYAHMSKFAPGLKAGDKVDVHQLIGYVGTTGRSTGPHLHFSLKRNGQFVDPLTLKMDGERVIPKPERDDFDALKAELDKLLDGMPLPDRDSTTAPSNDDDPDEDNHEGDDKGDKGDKNDDGSKPDEPKEATTGSADSKSKESKKEGKKDGKKDADSKGDTGAQDAKPVEEGPLDSAVWKPLLANSPVCEPAGYSFSGSHGIDR